MPDYRIFQGSAGSVTLEVAAADGAASGAGNLRDAVSGPLQSIVTAFTDELGRMPQEKKPAEVEITFGLKALNNGGFAVTLNPAQASFGVRMKWTGGGGGDATRGLFPTE